MKSQRRRAESLSRRLLSREHSRALFWENFITSTLWVSSLMDSSDKLAVLIIHINIKTPKINTKFVVLMHLHITALFR